MNISISKTEYPLSPMQQGMLFHTEYAQQPGDYIEQVVANLYEVVRVPLLLSSWQQVVDRHSVLRTSFQVDLAGELRQAVNEPVELPFSQQNWQGLSPAAQAEKLADYLQADRQTNFELDRAPLMRLSLFQRDEADYTLVWTFHHAILDGRSISIVLQEVFARYHGQYALAPTRPYRDYIDWLQQQSWASAETFWREYLRGFIEPTPLPLPSEIDDGVSQLGMSGKQKLQLSPQLTSTLQNFATAHQLTLNTLVQAAWAIMLSRYSDRSEVVFGATRACRHSSLPAIKSMVGLFINTLPVRVQVNAEIGLLPWLKTLRAQWVAFRDYENTPLVKVLSWSDVPQGSRLFDSLVIFDHVELDVAVKSEGSQWQGREFELIEQIPYPLILKAAGGNQLNLTIEFDLDRFTQVAVMQMLGDLETLLQNFASYPQAQIGELSMNRPSCFVVGNGVIPLSCLEILVKQGWRVLGVHSTDNSLQGWAEANDLPHTDLRAGFREQLLNSEYDYLFSINNVQWIIPPEILARARKSTINYHDSPLPKYAGLYATSWALLNGESEHAVTWHEVTPEIDAGQIFKQKTVPIFADDTVFLLNTRCFEAAVKSFEEMIVDLGIDRVKFQAQDLSQRSYFGPSDRPAASSLLSFDDSSQTIYNLVRALEFGPTRNQLGVPKIWLPGGLVAVSSARMLSTEQGVPGQVLKLTEAGLSIATTDGAIELSGLTTLEGQEIAVERLMTDYGVRVGEVLAIVDRATRDAITERNAAICRHEEAWAKRLIQLAPFKHPYLPIEVVSQRRNNSIYRYPITSSTPIGDPQSLLPIFAAYCARLTADAEFDLGLQTDAQRSIAPEIFAQRVPLRVQTQPTESFRQFKERLEISLHQTSRLGSFRYSLLRRYPELREYAQSISLPVAIVLAPSPDQLDWQHLSTTLAFVAYADGSLPELVHGCVINDPESHAIVQQLQSLISACLEQPDRPLDQLPLLSSAAEQQILLDWNRTERDWPSHLCIHQLFEQQVERTPEAIAVAFGGEELTYRELNHRANQLAHYLRLQGVAPDVLVGLHIERSLAMMVGLLGIHKAGGAYVPLDPDFPTDRIALMLEDSQAPVIVTQQSLVSNLAVEHHVRIISIDTQWAEIAAQPRTNPDSGLQPANLSYVLYTSGSTGKPKGVMVEHRNVVNFFTGMDDVIDRDPPGVWLAVTSLSFDISVLELFWTLARGFKVVIYNAKAERAQSAAPKLEIKNSSKTIDFSLFYFSSSEEGEDAAAKYRLLFEGAKFGDEQGFKAVWTPERHFHAFGGLFPNSAVTSAAIAATTKQIQIRAGSCVAPLHSSVRIAEDWSVVDNFSVGRVGIAFAAGWQPNDFVLRPETFEHRKKILFQQVEEVRSLWRGESVNYLNGKGENVAVKTLPRPIQPELPVWITAAGNPETFQMAGAKGFNILTHLLGQSLEELAAKIALYRQAWTENGHHGQGTVTLMIHSFVGESNAAVKEIVRQPMRHYLGSSLDLIKQAAWSFPTFKQKTTSDEGQFSVTHLSEQELDEVLDFSFERYFETSGLFGTVETCLAMVDRIKGIDVNELACLIDYGVDTQTVLNQLPLLNEVKIRANHQSADEAQSEDNSIASLIQLHQVTHLQCTPSMASLLIADPSTRTAMRQIRNMMVGGEAFTEALASQLQQTISGKIHNMYGPTETTIWSATHTLSDIDGVVPLGRPIANTELYILDRHQQPVPVGIAGELLIGGQGVTRGYLNRPELTQERFVPHPFSTDPTTRLYRTGDLVRYRMDGNLEFLGRIDFQVKVRGYRIELGEIETILSRHPSVREAVTIVREDIPGDKRIVAYLIPQPGQQPTNQDLRAYLLSSLPEYMVPSNFVWLESFPLTPNKKVDRKALPAPVLAVQPEAQSAPQSISLVQTEQTLMEIWQEVLQISAVGLQDNFFDLGGNSLVAVTLIGKIRSTFNVNLPLVSLFRSPTVADLAQEISVSNKAEE